MVNIVTYAFCSVNGPLQGFETDLSRLNCGHQSGVSKFKRNIVPQGMDLSQVGLMATVLGSVEVISPLLGDNPTGTYL